MKYFLLFILLLTSGCAAKFEAPPLADIKLENDKPYVLDLSTIAKPEKMNTIWVDENYNETTPENAKYALLTQEEYAKIGQLIKLALTYKELAVQESELVNLKIDTINSLKAYVELERFKAQEYRSFYQEAQNRYLQERHDHKVDKIVDKAIWFTTVAGAIVLAITL